MQYVVQKGEQKADLDADDLATGSGFEVSATSTEVETLTASSQVEYDLIGEISEKAKLTRRTVTANPQQGQADDLCEVPTEPRAFHHRIREDHQRTKGRRRSLSTSRTTRSRIALTRRSLLRTKRRKTLRRPARS